MADDKTSAAKAVETPDEETTVADAVAETPTEATPTSDAAAPAVAAAPAPDAPAPVDAPPADLPDETVNYVAARDFKARFEHQVHSFVEGQVIDSRVGHALRKTGSPIKLVEKLVEEIKAAL